LAVKVGLVGYGLGGSVFHAPLIAAVDRLDLTAISTRKPISVPGARIVPDSASLIADPELDLIVVASPHNSHFPLAKAALEAGKHVVVDKPFALASAEADILIQLAAERGLSVTPFHNRRWDGDFLTVQRFIAGGKLGDIVRFEAHWDRFRPGPREGWKEVPEQGAGLLNDLGPHLVDQALLLFGWPEAVQADIAVQRKLGAVDDYFELTLHYGIRRVILGSTLIGVAERPRFAVHGTGGSLVKYGLDPQEERLKAGISPRLPGFGDDEADRLARFTDADAQVSPVPTEPGCYDEFYKGVAECILAGAAPPVDPRDARDGLHIIELSRQSARDGKTIITRNLRGERQ
jgi:scyllo-inositol 2-dehydrogenase (NADP+)